ncbi:MAG: DUF1801 domain-containing protein [candidate division Zixibacteria bacterium]|nr:DUF1801 domain-containing protein [candidate division Zixibacteria bacterium]
MAEVKTKETRLSVAKFIGKVESGQKRKDSEAILKLMKQVTKEEPKMWGASMIGFGRFHYKSDSGREGDWLITGFSPRKQNLTIYITPGFDKYESLMKQLGKHKTSKGCLYIKKLEDIDMKVLKQLIKQSYQDMKKKYK